MLRAEKQRRGTSAIVVILLFSALVVISFFVINVSLIQQHHASSQIAADLASRYGVDAISRMDSLSAEDLETIQNEVVVQARRNWTLTTGERPNIEVDVEFGSSTVVGGRPVFREGATPINSVRVSLDKNVQLFEMIKGKPVSTVVRNDATAAALERDLCLVVDRSGSMNFDLNTGNWMYEYGRHSYNALSMSSRYRRISYSWWWYWPHPTRSRWSTMVPALYGLVEELEDTNQNELFSIASYSSTGTAATYDHRPSRRNYRITDSGVEAAPTYDYLAAVTALDNKYKYTQPVAGGTNIAAGIDEAREILMGDGGRPFAFKTMIVMTDGQYNAGRAPWLAAEDAADEGIQVHTVTFSRQADQDSMERTAEAGNGVHFHAPDGDALESVFREIAKMPAAAIIE